MSEVVQFPGIEREWSEAEIDRLLRPPSAIWRARSVISNEWGEISQRLIMQCMAREDGLRELELAQFAVLELAKMLRAFSANYYKRWHGELVGPS